MPKGTRSGWSPWRILLAGLLASTLISVVLVALGIRWFILFRQQNAHRAHRREQIEAPGGRVPAPPTRLLTEGEGGEDSGRLSTNDLLPGASLEKSFRIPKKNGAPIPKRNAILAFKNSPPLPGDDIFKDLLIPSLEIEIPPAAASSLTRSPRKYVRASIREGKTVYTNVAIRLKGGPGSFRQFHDRPAFTVNFDKFAPGQTFHGLKKIHLNNSVQDGSYLNEKISRELFEAAGVPVPRAGHAVVTIDDREPALYVLLEGVNKQFLKRYFKDAEGNVYDGHSQTDVTQNLPINSGEDPTGDKRLRDLANAAKKRDYGDRLAALSKTLDLDRFLSYLAMEMILWHWDGYTMNRNNYRIFHDRDTDRMVFIPQGMDQMFAKPRGSIIPERCNGLVARSVLEIPEAFERYRERVDQITTNIFLVEAITNRIYEVAAGIHAALAEMGPRSENYRQRVSTLCSRVRARASYLHGLVAPAAATKFDEEAVVSLTEWHGRIDIPDAQLDRQRDEEGNTLLHISTENGCTASWRTSAVLESGTYRLEARIKTRGVVFDPKDPRAGAGLRISGHRVGQKNSGDRDWTRIYFDFPVRDDHSEVELICELRANSGEIWYDLASLKLRRK